MHTHTYAHAHIYTLHKHGQIGGFKGTFVFDGDGKCVFAFRADDANQVRTVSPLKPC